MSAHRRFHPGRGKELETHLVSHCSSPTSNMFGKRRTCKADLRHVTVQNPRRRYIS